MPVLSNAGNAARSPGTSRSSLHHEPCAVFLAALPPCLGSLGHTPAARSNLRESVATGNYAAGPPAFFLQLGPSNSHRLSATGRRPVRSSRFPSAANLSAHIPL